MEDKEAEETGDAGIQVWHTRDYYDPPPELPYAAILLNKGVTEANVGSVQRWWCGAHLRVCVDGAINAFHRLMQQQWQEPTAAPSVPPAPPPASCPLPDVISGDFDSAHPALLKTYAAKGVCIMPTPDQDETDFTKALRVLAGLLKEQQISVSHILVVAGSDNSRFDHVLAIVATLYKAGEIVSVPVVVVSGRSLFWVLRAGRHSIRVAGELSRHPSANWCGLVPVGHSAIATTTGLKWNIDHKTLAFGQLVSTSNTYNLPPGGGEVTVATSSPLLWTMGWKVKPTEPCDHFPPLTDVQNGSSDNT